MPMPRMSPADWTPQRVKAAAGEGGQRARGRGRMREGGLVARDGAHRRRPLCRDHRQASRGVRPPRSGLHRPGDRGHRVRPRPPDGGRHREGDRRRRSHQRRQLEHHDRSGRARDLRRRAGRRPASTTRGAPRSTSDSASPRSRQCRGRPSGCSATSSPSWPRSTGSIRAPRSASSSGRSPEWWAGRHRVRARGARPRPASSRSAGSGSRRSPRPDLVAQEGDVAYVAVGGDAIAAFDERLAQGATGRH